ncbi:MAG: hypothetical protein U5M23_10685 [Marinagarivorans sp.]|nr:hypothetical protein [Marinagarivorans sp.]
MNHTAAARAAKEAIFNLRRKPEARAEAKVVEKHASRKRRWGGNGRTKVRMRSWIWGFVKCRLAASFGWQHGVLISAIDTLTIMRDEMSANGQEKWTGYRFEINRNGTFKFNVTYGDSQD